MTIAQVFPVVGALHPAYGQREFQHFNHGKMNGLARVVGDRVELLVLYVKPAHRNQGVLRDFLNECKEAYKTIMVLEILNDELDQILERYGFVVGRDSSGTHCRVWRRR